MFALYSWPSDSRGLGRVRGEDERALRDHGVQALHVQEVSMKCSVKVCDNEAAVPLDLCNKHRPYPPSKYLGRAKASRIGKDRKRAVYPGPSNSPNGVVHVIGDRCNLIGRLADAVGNDHANAIADALDGYLETDSAYRLPAFPYIRPNPPNPELDKVRKERDEAVARAEEAESKLRCTSTTHDKIAGTDTRCVLDVGHTGCHEGGAMAWDTKRVSKKKSR